MSVVLLISGFEVLHLHGVTTIVGYLPRGFGWIGS